MGEKGVLAPVTCRHCRCSDCGGRRAYGLTQIQETVEASVGLPAALSEVVVSFLRCRTCGGAGIGMVKDYRLYCADATCKFCGHRLYPGDSPLTSDLATDLRHIGGSYRYRATSRRKSPQRPEFVGSSPDFAFGLEDLTKERRKNHQRK